MGWQSVCVQIWLLVLVFCCARGLATSVPLPTRPQLRYQQHEIMALIHFNMATFIQEGDPGCSPKNWNIKGPKATGFANDPKTFNPTQLDTDQWTRVMKSVGAKHAVLTAKHGCGFLLWPTRTKLPGGKPYSYDVSSGVGFDVLQRFIDSCRRAGIGTGFYYSLTNNFYLNLKRFKVLNTSLLPGQEMIEQQDWETLAMRHLEELWSNYGHLDEIWMDGGHPPQMEAKIKSMLARLQPHAAVWNGLGVSPNPLSWVGTESGLPNKEIWSTGDTTHGPGSPNSTLFNPRGSDTTLQAPTKWFYEPKTPIYSLEHMIQVYHETVGRNSVLEIDFAINRQGVVEPAHVLRYQEFGSWISRCYGSPVNAVKGVVCREDGCQVIIPLKLGTSAIDRVMIQEDLAQGQRILSYRTDIKVNGEWQSFSTGHSVGNKRIDLSKEVTGAAAVRLTVLSFKGTTVEITNFAAFAPCPTQGFHQTVSVS